MMSPRSHASEQQARNTLALETIKVGAAQINPQLGRIGDNLQGHLACVAEGREAGLDLLVFPELSLTGYRFGVRMPAAAMPRDDERLSGLADAAGPMQVVAGFIEEASPGEYYNALAVLQHGRVVAVHRKLNLPNYGELDEGKYFCRGTQLTEADVCGQWRASYLICADLWNPALVHAALLSRPSVLVAPIASATGVVSDEFSNETNWVTNVTFYSMTYGTPLVLANRYGPEGEAFFWGGSRIMGPRGETLAAAEPGEGLITATLKREAIARARFDMPTHRDANTPLIQALLSAYPR